MPKISGRLIVRLTAAALFFGALFQNCSSPTKFGTATTASTVVTASDTSLTPAAATVAVNSKVQFQVSKGALGTFQATCGSVVASTGVYTAPSAAGVCIVSMSRSDLAQPLTSTITVVSSTASSGSTSTGTTTGTTTTTTTTTTQVSLNYSAATMSPDQAVQFTASGGSGYTYTLSNNTVGWVSTTGIFTSVYPGTVTLTVTNSANTKATAAITVLYPAAVPVYRGVNNTYHDHIYTLDPNEIANSAYTFEAAAFGIFTSSHTGTTALYRCLTSSAQHFLSTDSNCEGNAVQGILGYVYNYTFGGALVPLYRFSSGGDHLNTLDYNEGVNAGYTYEAILGNVVHL